jgi:hypothetical protein
MWRLAKSGGLKKGAFSYLGYFLLVFFFFKQKTAYEMLDGDWSSDVCSSDLLNSFICFRLAG